MCHNVSLKKLQKESGCHTVLLCMACTYFPCSRLFSCFFISVWSTRSAGGFTAETGEKRGGVLCHMGKGAQLGLAWMRGDAIENTAAAHIRSLQKLLLAAHSVGRTMLIYIVSVSHHVICCIVIMTRRSITHTWHWRQFCTKIFTNFDSLR